MLRHLQKYNYAISRTISSKLHSQEMNKVTLFAVFICGAVFAMFVSFMRNYLTSYTSSDGTLLSSLGVLPAGANLGLMDDGYVAMALLGAHDNNHAVSKKQTTELEDKNAEVEALNTVKAARDLVSSGKSARAGRLLEHALSLAPYHPDVLIHYGEFLENHRNDVVRADKLYLRALEISPANSRALRNRRRTQPLVDELDSEILSRIDNKRDDLARIPLSSASLRRIKKEAYYHHVYHTAGLEGNTMTLAQTRSILETRLSVGGKSVMEHNEILGLDAALKYINQTLVHRIGRISLFDILEIHRRVLGHVDPIQAGTMRTTQVYVSDHVPPPPTRLQVLMEDFLAWLNSPEAQRLHPIKYAALAHYKLVFIHPFADGNGRTARLLMNFLLMQAGYPPVIIRKQDRLLYYDCLNAANDGDTRPFVRFIAHCTEKTIDVYLWATREALPKIGQEMHSAFEKRRKDSKLRKLKDVERTEGSGGYSDGEDSEGLGKDYSEGSGKYGDRNGVNNERNGDKNSERNGEDSEGLGKDYSEGSGKYSDRNGINNERNGDKNGERNREGSGTIFTFNPSEDNQYFDEPHEMSITEDHILSEDEEEVLVDSLHTHDFDDDRPHLWFSGEEDIVDTGGRFGRVLDERSIYAEAEILDHIRKREEYLQEDNVDYFPRAD